MRNRQVLVAPGHGWVCKEGPGTFHLDGDPELALRLIEMLGGLGDVGSDTAFRRLAKVLFEVDDLPRSLAVAIEATDGLLLLVCGDGVVSLPSSVGPEVLSAAAVAMWAQRVVPADTAMTAGASSSVGGSEQMQGTVVRGSGFSLGVAASVESAPDQRPSPAPSTSPPVAPTSPPAAVIATHRAVIGEPTAVHGAATPGTVAPEPVVPTAYATAESFGKPVQPFSPNSDATLDAARLDPETFHTGAGIATFDGELDDVTGSVSVPIPTPVDVPDPVSDLAAPTSSGAEPIRGKFCECGHFNSPVWKECRACGRSIEAVMVQLGERPPLGVVRFSDGQVVPLDRSVVVGRGPRPMSHDGRQACALVVIDSPDKVISRNHFELKVEDWTLTLIDRGSRNGTRLRRGDSVETVVRPHGSAQIDVGDTILFADHYAEILAG